MTENLHIYGRYFCGNEISEYGRHHGRVDYATLAKSFNLILNNTIISKTEDFELINGSDYDDENDEYIDIFQYYIIDESGANILTRDTNEIVYYSNELDVYLWGVTHYGTAWEYVLTDIPCDVNTNAIG